MIGRPHITSSIFQAIIEEERTKENHLAPPPQNPSTMKASTLLLPLLSLLSSPLTHAAPVVQRTDASPRNVDTSLVARDIDINVFLAEIAMLFPFSGLISVVSGLITDASQELANVFGVPTTENGLSGACGDVTIIYARGTSEPGNVGILVGPPFFQALQNQIGGGKSVVVQGVAYPASIEGFLAGGTDGSQTMANLVQQAISQCPNTKVIMSGYSQGCEVVHHAASLLPSSAMSAVNSVVLFGDPEDGSSVAGASSSKTLVICHFGDDICLHGDLILLPHLTYAENADQAASFAAGKLGF